MSVYSILDKVKTFPYDIKHWYQRAKYGYSYRDRWSIDNWFLEIMPKMLQEYKRDLHGCPAQFVQEEGKNDQDVELGMKNWRKIIDRMIFCFTETNEDTCSMKNEYQDEYMSQRFDKSRNEMFIPNYDEKGEVKSHTLNCGEVEPQLKEEYDKKRVEIEEYRERMKNEGFKLFSEYFWNLWD